MPDKEALSVEDLLAPPLGQAVRRLTTADNASAPLIVGAFPDRASVEVLRKALESVFRRLQQPPLVSMHFHPYMESL